MHNVLLALHIIVAIALVGLVLIQHGKGADAGAAFGSGASATVFGSRGSSSFLTRASAVLATVFFMTSLSLAYFSVQGPQRASVTQLEEPRSSVGDENIDDIPIIPSLPKEEIKDPKRAEEPKHIQQGKPAELPVEPSEVSDMPSKPMPTER